MIMEAAQLLRDFIVTGTSAVTHPQNPYFYNEPQWTQPPVDPIADAINAAVDTAAAGAIEAARAVWGLLRGVSNGPSVVVEDNEITLEWYKDRHHVAVVAVDGQSISWAVMAGPANPIKGKQRFDNKTLPSEAYDAIIRSTT
jgi:hypothetical protein